MVPRVGAWLVLNLGDKSNGQTAETTLSCSVDEFEDSQARARPALMRPLAASDALAVSPRSVARRSRNLVLSPSSRSCSSPNPASSTSDAANTYWHGAPRSA